MRHEQETDMVDTEQVPRTQSKFSGKWWKPKSTLKKSHLHCLDPTSSHSMLAGRYTTGHIKCADFYSAKNADFIIWFCTNLSSKGSDVKKYHKIILLKYIYIV